MTLEEALKRIGELEQENAALKASPRPYKDPYPGFSESWLKKCNNDVYDSSLGTVCSLARRVMFGTVPCRRVMLGKGENGRVGDTDRAKKVIELNDAEYAHYTKFFHSLLNLIEAYAKEWKNKEENNGQSGT